jgi:hypothetical protein
MIMVIEAIPVGIEPRPVVILIPHGKAAVSGVLKRQDHEKKESLFFQHY